MCSSAAAARRGTGLEAQGPRAACTVSRVQASTTAHQPRPHRHPTPQQATWSWGHAEVSIQHSDGPALQLYAEWHSPHGLLSSCCTPWPRLPQQQSWRTKRQLWVSDTVTAVNSSSTVTATTCRALGIQGGLQACWPQFHQMYLAMASCRCMCTLVSSSPVKNTEARQHAERQPGAGRDSSGPWTGWVPWLGWGHAGVWGPTIPRTLVLKAVP